MTASKQLFFSFLIFVLLLTVVGQAKALGSDPPELPTTPQKVRPEKMYQSGPQQDQKGIWYVEDATAKTTHSNSPALLSSGPDDFGYTLANVDYAWIDASGGTDTGLSGEYANGVGPIPIPFDFKYYENSYNEIFISAYGYAMFSEPESEWWEWQGEIPAPSSPNNVIAPLWAPTEIRDGAWVRYISGGTAPNQYFVVEWNQVKNLEREHTFTFQMILHENGDIVFQYGTLYIDIASGGWSCSSSGIEDSRGFDGLTYREFCGERPTANSAVRFYRPVSSARASLLPGYQTELVSPITDVDFKLDVTNTGELGSDTYNLTVVSAWPVILYAADGVTPLIDTNGDLLVDVGALPQGAQTTVIARMQVPDLEIGQSNQALVTAHSTLDPVKIKTVTLHAVVPARFAQAYHVSWDVMDQPDGDANGDMLLDIIRPDEQNKVLAAMGEYANDPSVASAPGSNLVYVWSKQREISENVWGSEIKYSLISPTGRIVREVSKLTDATGSGEILIYDGIPAPAIAPNGTIGIAWVRTLYNVDSSLQNMNIFFAILSPDGDIIQGPINLTNNTGWWDGNDPDFLQFQNPQITATDDSRFTIAWELYYAFGLEVRYTVWDSAGNQIKPPAFIANSWGDGANLVALSGNRVFMTSSVEGKVYYAILDSAGNIEHHLTYLSSAGDTNDRFPEAVLLFDGKILIAWSNGWSDGDITYAMLDDSYNLLFTPQVLHNPFANSDAQEISATADTAGRAVLTWNEGWDSRNLYYALVDGSGSVITAPIVYRHSLHGIESSTIGYGNATVFDGSFSGYVYKADGVTPIANMAISLIESDGVEYAQACTDTNGFFTLDSIPYGVDWYVEAVPAWRCPGQPESYVREYWQDTYDQEEATLITLSESQPNYAGIVFKLEQGQTATQEIGTGGGTVVTPEETVSLVIPPGAVSDATTFTVTDGGAGYQVATDQGDIGVVLSTTIGPEGTSFATPATLSFSWPDVNNDGVVDGTTIPEGNLYLSKDGVILAGPCSTDPACNLNANTITVQISSLSFFVVGTINQAPTELALSNASVLEGLPSGTLVGTFTTTDPDVDDSFTYTLVAGAGDSDNTAFTIDGVGLKTAAVFDFALKNSYSIRVRTTDGGGLSYEKIFTITVTDVAPPNQAPTNISISNASLAEGQSAGTVVGDFTTTDLDAGDTTFTYALVAGTGDSDNTAFAITGNTLKAAQSFNYAFKNSYSIRVRTTDNGGLSFEKAFIVTISDQPPVFSDVPDSYWAASFIERLYNSGVTGGCSTNPTLAYCPDNTVTRAQMAVFLLKSMHGAGFNPPLVGDSTGFGDVATSHWAAPWIKQLALEGITGGCGNGNYCPESPVTRAQMAVFLLKAKNGSGYAPPLIGDGSGFTDVPDNYWAAVWIKQLAADGITGGCGAGVYCPESPVTRAQMAVFIVKTFGLP